MHTTSTHTLHPEPSPTPLYPSPSLMSSLNLWFLFNHPTKLVLFDLLFFFLLLECFHRFLFTVLAKFRFVTHQRVQRDNRSHLTTKQQQQQQQQQQISTPPYNQATTNNQVHVQCWRCRSPNARRCCVRQTLWPNCPRSNWATN